MKKWNEAMSLIKTAQKSGQLKNDKYNIFKILKMRAEGEYLKGNWKSAVDLLKSANQDTRAIEILIEKDQEEEVLILMRKLNKNNHADTLKKCSKYFMGKRNHNAGKEALLKLGDQEELMRFHVSLEKWDEAQMLADSDDSLRSIMLIPYADWLSKKNRFDEASQIYKEAGRGDLAMTILKRLSEGSVILNQFNEAGKFHWVLARETLKNVRDIENATKDDEETHNKFLTYMAKSYIYHAYRRVYGYVLSISKEENYPDEKKMIFNASRFIMCNNKPKLVKNISIGKVLYALGTLANSFGGYKISRIALERLNNHVVPAEWIDESESHALAAKAKPMKDSPEAGLICPRWRSEVQPFSEAPRWGNCFYNLVISPLSFENLPLVEFEVLGETSHKKIMETIGTNKGGAVKGGVNKQPSSKKRANNNAKGAKMWDFNMEDDGAPGKQEGDNHKERLDIESEQKMNEATGADNNGYYNTPFGEKILETVDLQLGSNNEYIRVSIDIQILRTLDPDEVFTLDYRKYSPKYPVRYFKNMDPDKEIITCLN